jgi:DNA-binding IclR family transcriptional regulator
MATRSGNQKSKASNTASELVEVGSISTFRNRVKPVSNAIGILRYLSKSKQPATVTQLARQLGINTSTCFNILRTLLMEGLIEFDESSKSYRVGLGVVKLAEGVLTEAERLVSVRPMLHEIAEQYRVTLLLWRRIGDDRMLLVWVENSSADMQIHLRSGQRLPLLIGATGRVAASRLGLTKEVLARKFRSLRWAKRLSFAEYWRDVQTAAERGWAADDGYFSSGTTTVAVPIVDHAGMISHSLVAIMFRDQHDAAAVKRIAQDLIQVSKQLAAVLM